MNKLYYFRPNIASIRRCLGTTSLRPTSENDKVSPKYKPSELQKFILVWTKKYKTKEEIPTLVSPEIIERSRSEARIKISNIAILLTILSSIGAIMMGKAAAKRGESVHQMNLDWHKNYEDQYKKDQEKSQ